jgi:hypothetical protein
MDNKMFIIATIISVIFLIVKFIEMRFIDKENKPLKFLIRDAILVYFSVICGYLILEQLKPIMEEGLMNTSTPVFTDNPGF